MLAVCNRMINLAMDVVLYSLSQASQETNKAFANDGLYSKNHASD